MEDVLEDDKEDQEAGELVGPTCNTSVAAAEPIMTIETVVSHAVAPACIIPTAASAESDQDASNSIQKKIKQIQKVMRHK